MRQSQCHLPCGKRSGLQIRCLYSLLLPSNIEESSSQPAVATSQWPLAVDHLSRMMIFSTQFSNFSTIFVWNCIIHAWFFDEETVFVFAVHVDSIMMIEIADYRMR